MLKNIGELLRTARKEKYAVGAFNVYNLEGALAVIQGAEELSSPVIVQILPSALEIGGRTLIRLCLSAGEQANVPVGVHLDHCSRRGDIFMALENGMLSVMADGSALEFENNIAFTKDIVALARQYAAGVEGELGRITGTEDGVAICRETLMTDPAQAECFVQGTGVEALAVCIGNIHGRYAAPPELDFERLKAINQRMDIPLVLHGTSGLPDDMIRRAVDNGVCKFNVNTEIRKACIDRLIRLFNNDRPPELVRIMNESIHAMKTAIKEKIRLFGSVRKAV